MSFVCIYSVKSSKYKVETSVLKPLTGTVGDAASVVRFLSTVFLRMSRLWTSLHTGLTTWCLWGTKRVFLKVMNLLLCPSARTDAFRSVFQLPSSSHPSQIELAILKFPYDSWGTPFQQLKQVVDEESPQLPADRFSPEFVDFISQWWAGESPTWLFWEEMVPPCRHFARFSVTMDVGHVL